MAPLGHARDILLLRREKGWGGFKLSGYDLEFAPVTGATLLSPTRLQVLPWNIAPPPTHDLFPKLAELLRCRPLATEVDHGCWGCVAAVAWKLLPVDHVTFHQPPIYNSGTVSHYHNTTVRIGHLFYHMHNFDLFLSTVIWPYLPPIYIIFRIKYILVSGHIAHKHQAFPSPLGFLKGRQLVLAVNAISQPSSCGVGLLLLDIWLSWAFPPVRN